MTANPRQDRLFRPIPAATELHVQINVRIPADFNQALREHLGTGPNGGILNGKLAEFVNEALRRELSRRTRKLKVVSK